MFLPPQQVQLNGNKHKPHVSRHCKTVAQFLLSAGTTERWVAQIRCYNTTRHSPTQYNCCKQVDFGLPELTTGFQESLDTSSRPISSLRAFNFINQQTEVKEGRNNLNNPLVSWSKSSALSQFSLLEILTVKLKKTEPVLNGNLGSWEHFYDIENLKRKIL